MATAFFVGCSSTPDAGLQEHTAQTKAADTEADNDFFSSYQRLYVRPRAYPGTALDPAVIRSAFDQANVNRAALGMPHVNVGWADMPTSGPQCTPACSTNQGCFQGQCFPICGGVEFPCNGTDVPTQTPAGCLCLPAGSGGGPGDGGPGGGDGGVTPPTPGACAWTSVGPTNIQGRITSIAFDPNNALNVFAATVGGIWRSKDGARKWRRVSDDFLSTVASAIAVNPGNSSEVIAGLGEPDYFGSGLTGLVISTSGGDPGTFAAATGAIASTVVKKIVYSPSGTHNVYLATNSGVFLGTHSGGTLSFSRLGGMDASTSDIAVDFSGATPTVYAGIEFGSASFQNGIWKYSGTSWNERDSGIDRTKSRRIALGLAASSPSTLYARVENGNDGSILGLFQTTTAGAAPGDGGNAWAPDPAPNASALNDAPFGAPPPGQPQQYYGWWGNVLAVDPSDANIVFSGGVSLWRRTAAGWANASQGPDTTYLLGIHSDQHAIVLDPSNPKIVWVGNDGGIFKSTDMTGMWHWTSRAHGMVITEFYRGSTEQVAATILAGGSQDNGTEITFGNRTWYNPGGCDGNDVASDAVNSSTLYGNCNGGLFEFANPVPYTPGGQSQISWTLPSNVTATSPIVTDPTTAEIAVSAAKLPTPAEGPTPGQVLVKTTDGVTFNTILTLPTAGATVNSIAISRTPDPVSSKKTYYVGVTTGGLPTIYTSTDAGSTWNTTAAGLQQNLQPNAIGVDPADSRRAFVAFGGGAGGGVAITTNSGGMWTQLPSSGTTSLPSASVTGIVVDPNNPNLLYIATVIGVFQGTVSTSPLGSAWVPFDGGLPSGLDVNSISVDVASATLTIATMGHGQFQRNVSPGATCNGASLVVRDNVFDRGQTPSPSGVPDPEHPIPDPSRANFYIPDNTGGGSLYWWDSADIRIDVPSRDAPANAIAQADNYEFESCPREVASCPPGTVVDRSPERGLAANAYVQVNNRGLTPASNVRVIAMYADATTGTPDLPPNFWTTTFPQGSTSCGTLDSSTGWKLIGCNVIPVVNPDLPEVTQFNWNVPSTAADHTCFMTVIDSADDPIGASTRSAFQAGTVVPGDRHVSQRNLHVTDRPPVPVSGGGAGVPGGSGAPYDGLTSVLVPNRSAVDGVDLMFSRSGMGGGLLQFLLPPGDATAPGVVGLPPVCGTTAGNPPPGSQVVSISLPRGVSADEVVVSAIDDINIEDGATVRGDANGLGFIANVDRSTLRIPLGATVQQVATVGDVVLSRTATANGSVTSGGDITADPGSTILGTVTPHATLTPPDSVSWTFTRTGPNGGSIDVASGQTKTIAPGIYDGIHVGSGGSLRVLPGSYFVRDLDVEDAAHVELDGAVSFYVSHLLRLESAPQNLKGARPDTLLVFLGRGPLSLPGGLDATVVAPGADLALTDSRNPHYAGAFFGNEVRVGHGVVVVHDPSASFLGSGACEPLSATEQSQAASLGLDPTLYGVQGQEILVHLPIPAGQTWRVGLRYEAAAGQPNTAARFRIIEKSQGTLVGGNTFVLRH